MTSNNSNSFRLPDHEGWYTEQRIADLEEIIALYGTFNVDYKDLVGSALWHNRIATNNQ